MEANNIAAMRRGLLKAESLLYKIHYLNRTPELDAEITECIDEISIGLKQPLRNCDVGTPDEWESRFEEYCGSNYSQNDVAEECWRCPLLKPMQTCQFSWAQMLYEEGENNGNQS